MIILHAKCKIRLDAQEPQGQVVLAQLNQRTCPTGNGLFWQAQLDTSRTCVYWNDEIDLASDSIYEFGKPSDQPFPIPYDLNKSVTPVIAADDSKIY